MNEVFPIAFDRLEAIQEVSLQETKNQLKNKNQVIAKTKKNEATQNDGGKD